MVDPQRTVQVKKQIPLAATAGFKKSIRVTGKDTLRFRLFPEWTGLADLFHAQDHLTGVFMHV